MKDKYSSQIFRCDGQNVFLEIVNTCFSIGKVGLNFCEYDAETKKQLKKLTIYIDVNKALVLANDILNGNFENKVNKAKQEKTFNGSPINAYTSYFIDMGGINEDKVNQKLSEYQELYPFVQPGMAISRQLKIQAGNKLPWIIRAEYGPGKSNQTGLIVPNGLAPLYVNIPCTDDTFKEMAMAIKVHYEAYLNQYYNKFNKELFPSDKVNIFKPVSR